MNSSRETVAARVFHDQKHSRIAVGRCASSAVVSDNQIVQDNFVVFVAVDDLDAWWRHIQESGVLDRYPSTRAKPPTDYPWGNREVHLIDVGGVCWHFGG